MDDNELVMKVEFDKNQFTEIMEALNHIKSIQEQHDLILYNYLLGIAQKWAYPGTTKTRLSDYEFSSNCALLDKALKAVVSRVNTIRDCNDV